MVNNSIIINLIALVWPILSAFRERHYVRRDSAIFNGLLLVGTGIGILIISPLLKFLNLPLAAFPIIENFEKIGFYTQISWELEKFIANHENSTPTQILDALNELPFHSRELVNTFLTGWNAHSILSKHNIRNEELLSPAYLKGLHEETLLKIHELEDSIPQKAGK